MLPLIACFAGGLLAALLLRRYPQSGLRALLASGVCVSGFVLSRALC
jgi:hypothetical protein